MKFLPEDKKKRNRSIILLVLTGAAIIYVNFVFGGAKGPLPSDFEGNVAAKVELDPSGKIVNPGGQEEKALLPQSRVQRTGRRLTPYGSVIDTAVLEDKRYEALQAPPEFSVTEEELGNTNLFGP